MELYYVHDRSTVNFSTNLWIYYGRPLLDFNGACKDLASVEIWQKVEYYFDGTKALDLSGFKRNFDFLKNLFIMADCYQILIEHMPKFS